MSWRTWIAGSGISRSLIVSVILFSTVITLLITCMQLYRDYRSDIDLIEEQLLQIEDVHLRSLSASLWASDIKDLNTQAEGIMNLRDMQYLEVSDEGKQWVVYGSMADGDVITRSFPLTYPYRGRDIEIGMLTVVASLEGVYQRLLTKVVTIIVSNGVKTFLVAIFILYLFHYLVTRHLHRIAEYSAHFDADGVHQKLRLERKPGKEGKHDELDVLVDAITHMQLRLKSSIEGMKDTADHYRSLVESSFAIPWEFNPATFRFTYVGPQAVKILGYPEEEWYKENFFADKIHPDDRDQALSYCQTEYSAGRDHEFEYRMIAADGREVWLRDSVNIIREKGVPVRMQGYMFDVTARKEAEDAVRHAYDDLEEKIRQRTEELYIAKEEADVANRAKTEFLSRMSHELRTPLNAVLGFSQLLKTDLEGQPQSKEMADEIYLAGRHLLTLIEEIMDLSRIEMGKISINIETFNPMSLINEAVRFIRPQADQRGISIEQTIDENVQLVADSHRFKEVVLNLLSNAVKYNSDHGHIHIRCSVENGDMVCTSVQDTGMGLTADQQKLLFEPFSRLGAEYTKIEGTGIGLSIVKKLVELMHGNISVDSTPGKGTTFFVRLPHTA